MAIYQIYAIVALSWLNAKWRYVEGEILPKWRYVGIFENHNIHSAIEKDLYPKTSTM